MVHKDRQIHHCEKDAELRIESDVVPVGEDEGRFPLFLGREDDGDLLRRHG